MAVVTSAEGRANARAVYVPADVRGMAHYSYRSPDRKWVLLIEMDGNSWLPCRVVHFERSSAGRIVGPPRGNDERRLVAGWPKLGHALANRGWTKCVLTHGLPISSDASGLASIPTERSRLSTRIELRIGLANWIAEFVEHQPK